MIKKMINMIKKMINMLKPTKIILKDFNKWDDIGQWNNFNDIGKTIKIKK